MKQLTLRFEEELAIRIKELAKAERISLNQAAVRLMRKGAGIDAGAESREDVIGDALDHLAATWSKEEYDSFNEAVREFDHIDEEIWK